MHGYSANLLSGQATLRRALFNTRPAEYVADYTARSMVGWGGVSAARGYFR